MRVLPRKGYRTAGARQTVRFDPKAGPSVVTPVVPTSAPANGQNPASAVPAVTSSAVDTRSAGERGLAWYQANTGVPAGTVLKASGPITVNTAGAVIEGLDVTGAITVNAENVTIRNTRVRGPIVNSGDY